MSTTNRLVGSAQAGRGIAARPKMFVGRMAFRHTGIVDMTDGADGEDRPTFPYTFEEKFPIALPMTFDFTFSSL